MNIFPRVSVAGFLVGAGALALALAGCNNSTAGLAKDGGGPVSGGSAATGSGGNGSGNTSGGYDGPTFGLDLPPGTLGHTQCSDGIDNDGDGLIDYFDPECIGPLDNDESSFATGIPGDNVDACKQDCFFDGNSGMGDDGCEWQLKCDPANPGKNTGCPYDPSYKNCPTTQSQQCINFCQKLTPNGCDCFGCCDIPGVGSLLLLPTCTAAKFNDTTACPRCTQNTSCTNVCEHCELCIGKTTLPPDCMGGYGGADGGGYSGDSGYTPRCPSGQIACGPGGVDPAQCPQGTGCVTGCCIPIVQ